jgi:hypothetical protein
MSEYRLLFEHKPTSGRVTVHVEISMSLRVVTVAGLTLLLNNPEAAALCAVQKAMQPWAHNANPQDMRLVRCDRL